MGRKFLKYDWAKLIILIVFAILLIILLLQKDPARKVTEPAGDSPAVEGQSELKNKEENNLPDFPAGAESFMVDEAGTGLVDLDGNLRFVLCADEENWMPVIPDVIKTNLPDGYQVIRDESGVWLVISADDEALYSFNYMAMDWETLQKETNVDLDVVETNQESVFECAGANPRRIAGAGQKVRVVNALIPLRSSPDAVSANFIVSLPQDTILEIIAEPVCTAFLEGANLWWAVRTEDGLEGYVAEGSAVSSSYYLEVVE